MSDCLSLISTDVSVSDVARWTNVSQMTHILHTETVHIRSLASGYLDIEPFCVPDMDCRIVCCLVFHCCGTGAIHSWTDERISHVKQIGPDTCVKLDCWELNGKQHSDIPDVCWQPDPCKRLNDLRCCQMEWLKIGRKTDWSFRDSSGKTSYLPVAYLKEMISEAQAECESQSCVNTRSITYSCNNGYC